MNKAINHFLVEVLFVLSFYFITLHSVYAEAGNVWHSFIKNPNRNTYIECSKEIDSSLLGKYQRLKSPTYIALVKNNNIWKVLDMIEDGNRYAAQLTFQFYPLFWGNAEVHEFLDIYLGKLIKINPKLFLELIKKNLNRSFGGFDDLEGIFSNFGDEFVDDFEKQIEETEKRIAALQQVQKKELIALRDKIVRYFVEDIKSLEKFKKEFVIRRAESR